jgi:PAS domain S-box-containing protein
MKNNISDLIDFAKVDTLLEGFNQSTGFVTAILDLEGNVLSKSGWRQICTDFHRVNPETASRCRISDTVLANKMAEGEKYHFYQCLNGLVDVAVPIVIKGEHLANLFSGQFFFDMPDRMFFVKQAAKYGFDERKYIEALMKVPVVSREKVEKAMDFLQNMTLLISEITYQKLEQAELNKALRASEGKYRVLFNTFPLGITISDLAGNIVESNDRAAELLGIPKGEHESRRIDGEKWRIIRPDGTPMPVEEFPSLKALQENRLVENVEMGVEKPDGNITWLNVTASPIFVENAGVVITYNDITAHRKVEQDYQTLFREMLDGFALHEIICDEAGKPVDYRFLALNPAFERMTGLKADDVIGRTVREILPGIEDHWIETYGRVALTGEPAFFDRYSAEVNKHFEVTAFRPAHNQFACIVSDITLRKQAEQEKEKLQEQLTQAQKMESVGRLAGGVAHDFNNMLGVILGHTEMALDEVDPTQPLYDDLLEVYKAAERSAELTQQLLTFARKQVVVPKVINLNETVEGMLRMLRRLIGEDIDLVWKPGRNLQPVKIDPSQIHQLLANLCVNARDAISGMGKITIKTETAIVEEVYFNDQDGFEPGEYVMMAVIDNGYGMDQETLGHLFEPFYTTKDTGKGTGLGLASVYGIIKQNNGFINVYSEPEKGTAFEIYFPGMEAKTAHLSEKEQHGGAERGNETIMLVEDEPGILKMTTMMLERLGYRVLATDQPDDAVRLAREHKGRIDLLITDVVMPGMNGRDLAAGLMTIHPGLKCLFMSGYTANVISQHGVLGEGMDFIQKPFTRKDLAEKVREVLGVASGL